MQKNVVIDVELKVNTQEILSNFARQVAAGLMAIGATAEGYAKEDCPVDTGRLQNSISNTVDDNSVYIGTNVVYAPYQEFYDYKHTSGKAHFLRDAASTHGDEYKRIMEAALKD